MTDGCGHCPGSHRGLRPCAASATVGAGSWFLVEHPGPWAADGFSPPDGLPFAPAVQDAIGRALENGVRVQLIRRPGRRRRRVPPLRAYLAFSGFSPWLEGGDFTDGAAFDRISFADVAAGVPQAFGSPSGEPLFLVCAHGRRNVCCARLGGPLARDLAATFGDAVWETTHVGGDRFAGNLVCLPHGLYYGDVTAADAAAAAGEYRRGRILLDRYRGRGGLPEAAQAAEHAVREFTGARGADDVRVESVEASEIVVACAGRRYAVRVRGSGGQCVPGCEENHGYHLVTEVALLNATSLV